MWDGETFGKSIALHQGPIDSIRVSKSYVITGGRDMKVKVLDLDYKEISSIDLNDFKSVNG